jgi:uncharacterized PurR-regulated membrane protein YhhQ (DUF165 family)
MHHKFLIINCCLFVQFVMISLVARREYFSPYPSDPGGIKMKKFKQRMYAICLISWIVIAIAQWSH